MAKYSKAAQKSVASAMKRMEKGKLRSGKSDKKVTNPKQAIAIGLSEAKKKGAKVPAKKTVSKKSVKKSIPYKAAQKTVVKKAAPKKAVVSKKVAPKKKVANKKAPIKRVQSRKKPIDKKPEEISLPVDTTIIDSNLPPVEEKSPAIAPVIPDKIEDPIMITDKKALAKAVTKHDPKHPMQLSTVKRSVRASGKKPLWR